MTLRQLGAFIFGAGMVVLILNLVMLALEQPFNGMMLVLQMGAFGGGGLIMLAATARDKWMEERPRPPVIREPPFN